MFKGGHIPSIDHKYVLSFYPYFYGTSVKITITDVPYQIKEMKLL